MANRDQLLVSTDWLADNLDDPSLRIVEVDEDTDAYARGHIRGAVAVNWNTDLQDPLRRDFIAPEQFAKLQDTLGITPDTTVILYGGNNNWFAAYAYWYYKVYGHGPVKLLDGPQGLGAGGTRADHRPGRRAVDQRLPGARARHLDPGLPRPGPGGRRHRRRRGPGRRPLARGVPGREAGPRPPAPGGSPAAGPHPGGGQHPLGQGGRRRHRQVPGRRPAGRALRRPGGGPRQGRGRLLPDRRALSPHLVRAPRAARLLPGPQLRRLLDRVGQPGRRAHRAVGVRGLKERSGSPRSIPTPARRNLHCW